MGIRKILIMVVIAAAMLTGVIIAERSANGQVAGQAPSSPDESGRLDQILANQKSIMQSLESIKQELNIIKIRITQRQ